MMDELESAGRYSIVPNSLGYCGGSDFSKVFKRYREGKSTKSEMRQALKRFKSLYAYLKTIAKANKKNPFDRNVLEAFWIGNDLLTNVTAGSIRKLILRDLVAAGMDKKRAQSAADKLPEGILLHHSFNSIYLNFVGNKVKRTTTNFDKCRIGWGKVVSISKNSCILKYPPVKRNKVGYRLGVYITRRFSRHVCGVLLEPNIHIGDIVSTHWGAVVQKLNRKLLYSLKKFTNINLCHTKTI
jgi:hypothetical protein